MNRKIAPKSLEIILYLEEKLSPEQYRRYERYSIINPTRPVNAAPMLGSNAFDFYLRGVPIKYFSRVVRVGLNNFAERLNMFIFLHYDDDTDTIHVAFRSKTEQD